MDTTTPHQAELFHIRHIFGGKDSAWASPRPGNGIHRASNALGIWARKRGVNTRLRRYWEILTYLYVGHRWLQVGILGRCWRVFQMSISTRPSGIGALAAFSTWCPDDHSRASRQMTGGWGRWRCPRRGSSGAEGAEGAQASASAASLSLPARRPPWVPWPVFHLGPGTWA